MAPNPRKPRKNPAAVPPDMSVPPSAHDLIQPAQDHLIPPNQGQLQHANDLDGIEGRKPPMPAPEGGLPLQNPQGSVAGSRRMPPLQSELPDGAPQPGQPYPNTGNPPSGSLDATRVLDMPRPPVSPYEGVGAPGMAVFNGFLLENEKDELVTGLQKYVTYSDVLANTTIVAAGVRYFLNLVAKAGWTVEPADKSAEAQKYADLVTEIIHDMVTPWHRVVRRAALYKFYGFGIQEWTAKLRDDGVVGFADIEPRAQYTIQRWDTDLHGSVLGVVQRSPQDFRQIYLPRAKLIYLVDDSINDNPEGLGLFRHLVKAAKRLERYEFLEAWSFETDLRGIPVARGPLTDLYKQVKAGAISAADAAALRAPIEGFVQKHVKSPSLGLMLDSDIYRATGENQQPSPTYKWNVELLTNRGGPGLVEIAAAITRVTTELARVLGVEHLLLGTDSTGSFALSKDKTQSFGLTVDSALVEIRESFNKDVLGPLWLLNGWPKELKPKFKTEQLQYRDVEQVTSALQQMGQAGAPLAPNDPAVDQVRDLLGLAHAPQVNMSLLAPTLGATKPGQNPLQPPPGGGGKSPKGNKPPPPPLAPKGDAAAPLYGGSSAPGASDARDASDAKGR